MKARESILIIGWAILLSVVYGLIHDQITIRICPEYFTVYHPHLFATRDLTELALLWGVAATWWMGAFFGILLALAAQNGPAPTVKPSFCRNGMIAVLLLTGLLACLGGLVAKGHYMSPFFPSDIRIQNLPASRQEGFAVNYAAHNISYMASGLGAVILCLAILYKRHKLSQVT